MLRTHAGDPEAASFLLRMVWLGQIREALPEAKQQAMSPTPSKYQRMAAIRAVHAVGSEQDLRDVREAMANEQSPPNREWLNELCDTLKGSPEEIDWLLRLLARVEPLPKYTVDHLQDGIVKLVERMPVENVPLLLEGLHSLLMIAPYVDPRFCKISKRCSWLLHPAASAVERLVRERHDTALATTALDVGMLPMSKRFDGDVRDIKGDFETRRPEELNRTLFWAEVARARIDNAGNGFGRVTHTWQAHSFEAFWKFGADDFDYFIEEVKGRTEQDDKMVALSGAIEAYVQGGRGAANLKRLKAAAAGNAELEEQLQLFLHPPKRDDEISQQNKKWRQQAKARSAARKKTFGNRGGVHLPSIPDTLRNPGFPDPNDISKTQWYLHHHTRDKAGAKGEVDDGRLALAHSRLWRDIAGAYRDGAVLHAHQASPALRSEGAPRKQHDRLHDLPV